MSDKETSTNDQKPKCCKKKKVLTILGIVVLVLILILVSCVVFLNTIVKTSIETVGSTVTKCNITVGDVDISLLRGKVELDDLVVGNPENFKTPHAFKLTKIFVDLEPASIFKDKIIINEVQILAPEITYEVAPLKLESNIGVIQDNVNTFLPAKEEDKAKEKAKEEEKKPGKKVEIRHVLVQDGKINISATFAGGHALPVPLPKVEMNDIGKEKEVSSTEATATILSETLESVISVAKNALNSVGGTVKSVGSAVKGLFSGGEEKKDDSAKKQK